MKKDNMMVAKVNKEIGGWDYRGFQIIRNKECKTIEVLQSGTCLGSAKTLGEAKKIADDAIELESKKQQAKDEAIKFVSKKGTPYLLKITDGKIKAFTYEGGSIEPVGKKMYWSVTKEMVSSVASLA